MTQNPPNGEGARWREPLVSNTITSTTDILPLRAAQSLRALGLSVIPVAADKRPCVPWEAYQHRHATDAEVRHWWPRYEGVGVVTGAISGPSGLVVVDTDNLDAEGWALWELPPAALGVDTPRGRHRYYRHPGGRVGNRARVRTEDGVIGLDLRGDGGFVVAHLGDRYRPWGDWSAEGLARTPVFDLAWIASADSAVAKPATSSTSLGALEMARRWMARRAPAYQGQGGDNHTTATVWFLVWSRGLTEHEAMDLLIEWNRTCMPPWREAELRSKVRRALSKVGRYA